MIAYVKGILADVFGPCCIVITPGGVGYRIALPRHTLAQLPQRGEETAFYTSMLVREDAQELYGFATFEERQTFELLCGINKIGPKAALAVLSAYRPAELLAIAQNGDLGSLRKISGIGAKTSQHLLLELQDKMKAMASGQRSPVIPVSSLPGAQMDTLAALANLGYGEEECQPVVAAIFKEEPDLDVADAIRLALKELSRGRK